MPPPIDASETAAVALQVQVNLFCADVDACLSFYTSLGMIEAFRTPATGAIEHVEVETAGTRIGLTSASIANDLVGLGVAPTQTPATELVLWCQNARDLYERALAVGAASVVPPMNSADGRLHYGWVRDPDGHQVKFVQRR